MPRVTAKAPRGTNVVSRAASAAAIAELDRLPVASRSIVARAMFSRFKEDVTEYLSAAKSGAAAPKGAGKKAGRPAAGKAKAGGKKAPGRKSAAKRATRRASTNGTTRRAGGRSRKTMIATKAVPESEMQGEPATPAQDAD